jgi:hypothetical protein
LIGLIFFESFEIECDEYLESYIARCRGDRENVCSFSLTENALASMSAGICTYLKQMPSGAPIRGYGCMELISLTLAGKLLPYLIFITELDRSGYGAFRNTISHGNFKENKF